MVVASAVPPGIPLIHSSCGMFPASLGTGAVPQRRACGVAYRRPHAVSLLPWPHPPDARRAAMIRRTHGRPGLEATGWPASEQLAARISAEGIAWEGGGVMTTSLHLAGVIQLVHGGWTLMPGLPYPAACSAGQEWTQTCPSPLHHTCLAQEEYSGRRRRARC
jgi:hypothetical protein